MEDLVTVVITTYKRPVSILKRAVDSVIKQTYSNIELIVVNDFPEDKSAAKEIQLMLESYQSKKIQYLEPKKNSGACIVRNIGLQNAKGEFIAFLDDDDFWLENKVEVQVAGFKNNEIGVVYTPFYREYKGKREIMPALGKSGNITEYILSSYTMALFPMVRTSLVREIGGFDIKLQSSQDYDLMLRLSLITKFKYIDIPTAVYHVSEVSISTNIEKKIQGFERFRKKHKELYLRFPKTYHHLLMRMVNNMNNAGYYRYAFRLWKEGIRYHCFSVSNISEPLKGIIKRIIGKQAFH